MLPRVLMVASALVVPLLAALAPLVMGADAPAVLPLAAAGLAGALGLALIAWARTRWTSMVIGAALAGLAAHDAAAAVDALWVTGIASAPAVHDLREGPVSAQLRGSTAVKGYLRDEWVLDEYATPEGQRPDQNEKPLAVLVPMLPVAEGSAEATDVVVVARIAPDRPREGLHTITGDAQQLRPELLDSIFSADAPNASAQTTGVLVDTLGLPSSGQAWTRLLIVLASALGAAWMYRSALRGDAPAPKAPAK